MADAIEGQVADHSAETATRRPGGGDEPARRSPSYRAALAWFDDNLADILRLLKKSFDAKEWDLAFRLGYNAVAYLLRREAWDQLEQVALRAAGAAAALARPDHELRVLQPLGIARQMKGDDGGADTVFQRLDELTQKHGNDLSRAQLLAQWAQTKRRFGDLARANSMLRQSIDLYRSAGSVVGEGRSHGNLANLLDDEGAAAAALEMYQGAVDLFRRAGHPADLALALRNLALAQARRGNALAALEALADARAVLRSLGDEREEAQIAWFEAQVHWRRDDLEAAKLAARFVSERGDTRLATEARAMLTAAELLGALDSLIAASDDEVAEAVVAAHPALLNPSVDRLLTERMGAIRSADPAAALFARTRERLADLRNKRLEKEAEERWAVLERLATPDQHLPHRLQGLVRQLFVDDDPARRVALLREATALLGETHPRVRARLMSDIGSAVLDAGDDPTGREEAIAALERALKLWDRHVDPEGWAEVQETLGRAYRSRKVGNPGDNEERALGCFRNALTVYRRGSHRDKWLVVVHNLANTYRSRESDDRAKNIERAIRRYEAVLRTLSSDESPRLWAVAHGNLGYAYADRVVGNQAENLRHAIRFLNRALADTTHCTDPEVVSMLLNRSYALRKSVEGDRTENVERAIRDLDEALVRAKRAQLSLLEAQAASNLGAAWDERLSGNPADNIEKAIEWYQRALQTQSIEATPAAWAATVDNLANAYARRSYGRPDKNLERAIELHESALRVYSPSFQPLEWARTLHNLAGSLLRRPRPSRTETDRAIGLYREALTARRRESAPFDWAETTDALASALVRRHQQVTTDELDEAISLYRDALTVFDPELIPARARATASNLGNVLASLGRWDEAASAFRLALDASERLYRSSVLRASKDIELSESGDLARRAAYVLTRCRDLRGAVTVLELGRARALREALERDRVELGAAERSDPGAVAAYQQATERLRELEAFQRGIGSVEQSSQRGDTQRALVAEYRDAQAQLEAALGRIRRIPGFQRLLTAPSFPDVGQAAIPGCPLAYLLVTDWGSLALVVSRDIEGRPPAITAVESPKLAAADLGAALFKWDGSDLTGGYLRAVFADFTKLDEALAEVLPMVGRHLVGPLVRLVRGQGNGSVVLVPGGALAMLPLHAATDPASSSPRCALDDIQVQYAPSALALTAARAARGRLDDDVRVLAGVANPTGDLRYAEAEMELIRDRFPEARARFGSDGTVEAVLEDVKGASNLHLACHGRYDVSDVLSSHLLLADAPLTLRDIIGQAAFATLRLVTASACQTGVTDIVRLPDEGLGLPAGFLQAGAAGVVATLWSVRDASTALLMSKFYDLLTGTGGDDDPLLTPPAALKEAQLWLRDLSGSGLLEYASQRPVLENRFGRALEFARAFPSLKPFASPYHWAAFVFVGA